MGEVPSGARGEEQLKLIVGAARDLLALGACGRLGVDVVEVSLPEGAIVEPVIALPAIHHGAHRHRGLERRMRVDERHEHRETLVGGADHADLAVGLRHVLHQPLDGVVGIGCVIDQRGIERPVQRAGHDVIAFRVVLAAYVLKDADVPLPDEHLIPQRQRRQHVRAHEALGALGGVVRGAGEDDRRVLCALRDDDGGEELDPVAHRDHDLALFVVKLLCGYLEGRDVRLHGRHLRRCERRSRHRRQHPKNPYAAHGFRPPPEKSEVTPALCPPRAAPSLAEACFAGAPAAAARGALGCPMAASDILSALREILPADGVLLSEEERTPYECDALTAFRQVPRVVALPRSEAEVQGVLRACSRHHVPVVARGSGTGLSGGATPHPDGVLLSLRAYEPHPRDRSLGAHRAPAAGRAEPQGVRSRRRPRPVLRSGPVFPGRLLHRRQRRGELRRRALPEIRPDGAQRARRARLHHRRRAARVGRRRARCSGAGSAGAHDRLRGAAHGGHGSDR